MGFFENIFPLIVIYVIWQIFSKVQKSIPKDDKVGDQVASSGNGSEQVRINLRDVLQQILTGGEVELPNIVQPRGEEEASSVPRKGGMASVQSLPKVAVKTLSRPARQRDNAMEHVITGVGESPSLKRERRSGVKPSRRKLRQAVIWSEILAKPLALRHEERDGF
ncbi:MAG: hypothetical protein OEY01_10100 [Desulfobulbaceae bacterium]|nr:hypothetical protein [Desulfobulbaceae bacterium]HIJ79325.1 hypothetical protein [Deltaproteobacteria bacterium]